MLKNKFYTAKLLILTFISPLLAHPEFQALIPNGNKVPSPCNRTLTWPGIGHELLTGAGPLNRFGVDFIANRKQWTTTLCRMDSDGDGKTNGQELGDPDCQWTPGRQPRITDPSQLSHPGVCDPIDAPRCKGPRVDFLRDEPTCRGALNLTETSWCPAIESPDVKTLILRFNETMLPALETNYYCQTFQVPHDQDYHIVAWEPIISNPEIMHHLLLFICDTNETEAEIKRTGNYSLPVECGIQPDECTNQNIAWAFGFRGRCFNPDAGMLMGLNAYKSAILQIHYNNPMLKKGLLDSSGLKIYYTPKLRKHSITHIRPGQYDISIPPGSNVTTLAGKAFQTKACGRQQFTGAQKFHLTSFGMHMHQAGKHARVWVERPSGQKFMLMDEEYYYDRPKFVSWQHEEAIIVYPDDNIFIECTYDTTKRNKWTFFGKNTADEMCMAAIEFYPRINNANFIDWSNVGVVERCDQEHWFKGRKKFCDSKVLERIIGLIANDTKGNLTSECNNPVTGTESSARCCEFLHRNEFLKFECAYGSAFHTMRALLKEKMSPGDVANVHRNIVNCVTDVIELTTEQWMALASEESESLALSIYKFNKLVTVLLLSFLLF